MVSTAAHVVANVNRWIAASWVPPWKRGDPSNDGLRLRRSRSARRLGEVEERGEGGVS